MLFAQDVPHASVVVTVTGMAIASIGAAVSATLSYMAGRDRMKFDAKMSALITTVEECEQDRKSQRARLESAEIKLDVAETKASKLEGESAAMGREMAGLRDDVRDLRDRLYEKKS